MIRSKRTKCADCGRMIHNGTNLENSDGDQICIGCFSSYAAGLKAMRSEMAAIDDEPVTQEMIDAAVTDLQSWVT